MQWVGHGSFEQKSGVWFSVHHCGVRKGIWPPMLLYRFDTINALEFPCVLYMYMFELEFLLECEKKFAGARTLLEKKWGSLALIVTRKLIWSTTFWTVGLKIRIFNTSCNRLFQCVGAGTECASSSGRVHTSNRYMFVSGPCSALSNSIKFAGSY